MDDRKLTRLAYKIAIAVDEQGPLHRNNRGSPDQADMTGVSLPTIRSYLRRKAVPSPQKLEAICDAINSYAERQSLSDWVKLTPADLEDSNDPEDHYTFGERFNLDRLKVQQIIEESVYGEDEFFSNFSYENKQEAEKVFRKIKRLWHVLRVSPWDGSLAPGKLHVRFVTKKNRRYIIRAKLHQAIRKELLEREVEGFPNEHLNYLGAISVNMESKHCYYIYFEGVRSEPGADQVAMMLTDAGNVPAGVLVGTYSTFNRDDPALPISSPVVLVRETSDGNPSPKDFMHGEEKLEYQALDENKLVEKFNLERGSFIYKFLKNAGTVHSGRGLHPENFGPGTSNSDSRADGGRQS